MRQTLGAQFNENEANQFFARAFNRSLQEPENKDRIQRFTKQLRISGRQQAAASNYFNRRGTLKGFQGSMPSINDFYEAVGVPNAGPETSVEQPATQPVPPQAAVQLLLQNLNNPEVQRAFAEKYGDQAFQDIMANQGPQQ